MRSFRILGRVVVALMQKVFRDGLGGSGGCIND